MSAIDDSSEFDRHLEPRARVWMLPRLALRQRASEHPMMLFFVIVVSAFAAMILVPPSGSAFASLGGPNLATVAKATGTPNTSRLETSQADIACQGQAWGAESQGCLDVIARESGLVEGHRIRLIASTEPDTHTPNVF